LVLRKTTIFSQKIGKNVENCDFNIGSRTGNGTDPEDDKVESGAQVELAR
jgi:hypothetical protein